MATNYIHFVYKTTNKINGMFYIGVRSTKNFEKCKYKGSGKILKKAFLKYGKENFDREIIAFCKTRDDAFELEELIVNKELIESGLVYNLKVGGKGGFLEKFFEITKVDPKLISESRKRYCWITDGEANRQHLKEDSIPDGWTRGRTINCGTKWSQERRDKWYASVNKKKDERPKKEKKVRGQKMIGVKHSEERILKNKSSQLLASERRKELGIPHGNKGKKMPSTMNEKRLATRESNKLLEGY